MGLGDAVDGTAVAKRARPGATEWVLRALVALALLGSAWVHLDLWLTGYRQIDVIGPLFLVNVVAGVVIGIAIIAWRHWLPALAAFGFGAATLGAFVLSVTVGLFGTSNVFGGFHGFVEWFAAITEIVCILGGGALLLRRDYRGA